MNFPLYSFLVACLYSVLGGVHEWAGRLLSALFSVGTAGLLYLLVRRIYQEPWTARLSALLFLAFPLNLFFGRAFMPEALMLFFSVASLLSFDWYCQTQHRTALALAALSAALCFMVKIPTLYLGFPLVALAWQRWGWGCWRRPALWLYLALVLLPPALWYWHAHGLFEQTGLTFGIWNRYGYDKWAHGLLRSPEFYLVMLQRFAHDVYTLVGAALVLLGLLSRWEGRRDAVLYVWMGALALYVLLIPEGNRRLDYYQLPFVPVGAALAAKSLALLLGRGTAAGVFAGGWVRVRQWPQAWRVGLVLLLLAGTGAHSAWAVGDYYRPPHNLYSYHRDCYLTGRILDRSLPPGALLAVGDLDENAGAPNRAQSPAFLYYCHRKGWQITPEQFSATTLDSLAGLGADYFLVAVLFAAKERGFWAQLPARGMAMPSEYPRFSSDGKAFRRTAAQRQGPDRNFVLVRLRM
jgi:hypothetical protein